MASKIHYIHNDNITRPFPDAFEVQDAEFKINGNYVCVEPCGGGGGAQSGDIDIYLSSTGNDGTGDGSIGSPYLTFDRAIEHMNGIVTASGDIRVMMPNNYNCDVENGKSINHPNKIILMCYENNKFNFVANNNYIYALTIKNTFIEIKDCNFSVSRATIAEVSGGNNTLSLINCEGTIRRLVNSVGDNNKLYIDYTTLRVELVSTIRNFTDVNINYTLIGHGDLNISELLIFYNCNINNIGITLDFYNNEGPPKSIFKFVNCNILYLNFILDTDYDRHNNINDGFLYFDNCVVNDLVVTLHEHTSACMSFISTTVNYMSYWNVIDEFDGNNPLIYADMGSNIYINNLSREDYCSGDFSGYILNANHCSFIKVKLIEYYGNLIPSNSSPTWREPGDTYIFNSGKNGSCIYVDEVVAGSGGG